MLDPNIELVVDAQATIGEAPVWAAREGALYWVDVKAPALYRTDTASGETEHWRLPSEIGGFGLQADGSGAILALRSGVFALGFARGNLTHLAEPPFNPRTHRFNESDCDPAGRLWLGTMFEPEPGVEASPEAGHIYSFTVADGLVRHDEVALTANGFAWSPDGRTFYMAHTKDGRIEAIAFDAEQGRLGARRNLVTIPHQVGVPDGGAVDRDGFYWSAIHRGGRLHRYAPDGRLDREVLLPVQNPTMVAFGGDDLETLYVTSATHGQPGQPHEGGLFRCRPGVPGLARPLFGEAPLHSPI
ncbi:SMP-30/gluconolactonase/LRE family protein [Methylobacterium durans]|uniref:Gluconolaconase n=1 Tax=Methylobacterium durans TaxID=2202825 RepID=A0A2U8W1N1_9HYPH|nr:SMP-30/gluconolactonase/LRE family protein [Methylobacterium durans]AWN39541.1 gluconolaconase [Methylobacterium durans]